MKRRGEVKHREGADTRIGKGKEWSLFMKGRAGPPAPSWQVEPFVLLDDPLITLKPSASIKAHDLVLLIMNEPPQRQRRGIISYKQAHQYFN